MPQTITESLWTKSVLAKVWWKSLSLTTHYLYLYYLEVCPFCLLGISAQGTTPFPGLLHCTLDPYIIKLSVKQGGIKYHFLSLWYNSTWDWTPVFWAIGEHFNRLAKWVECLPMVQETWVQSHVTLYQRL